jgi:ribosome-associated heat shock protein Hsp15
LAEDRIRIDKWLWQARFFKTRSLAAGVVASGHLRLNGAKMAKPGHDVRSGDVLTFPQGDHIRVVRVRAPGTRRGPADEARTLYADLDAGAGEAGPAGPGGAE